MKRLNRETLFGVKNQRLLSNSFATIRSKLLLYSFAVGLATMAFRKLTETAIEQERVEKKLSHQLCMIYIYQYVKLKMRQNKIFNLQII